MTAPLMTPSVVPDRRPGWWRIVPLLAALAIGIFLGGGYSLTRSLFGPDPTTVATSALQSMRAQNRLIPFVARYVSVVTTRQQQLGGLIASQRTLVLPGDVRYELNLARLKERDVAWDKRSSTLTVTLPEIEIAGPDIDLATVREYGDGGLLSRLTDQGTSLDQANRVRAVADLRAQAKGAVPMRLARDSARRAVEQNFLLPLRAAGFDRAQVIARFASDGEPLAGEVVDHSRSYNEILSTAR